MHKGGTVAFSIVLALLMQACVRIYVPDIQQGNVITQEMVNQIKPGMTRRQVQLVLGTPLIADPFHRERWDYYYSYRRGKELEAQRMLSLRFRDDVLVEVRSDVQVAPPKPEKLESTAPPPTLSAESR